MEGGQKVVEGAKKALEGPKNVLEVLNRASRTNSYEFVRFRTIYHLEDIFRAL